MEMAGEISLQLLAVNEAGFETGLEGMASLGDLPLLQDTRDTNAWDAWEVTYRDVWVLDGDNRRVGVINLTEQDLAEPSNRAALKALLRRAANR